MRQLYWLVLFIGQLQGALPCSSFISFFSVIVEIINLFLFNDYQIRFIDNTDPAGIDHQIAQLGSELASTLVIVVSKVRIEKF